MSATAPIQGVAPLAEHVRVHAFSPSVAAVAAGRRIGAEVELLPVDASTRRICPITDSGQMSSLRLLRSHAARHRWMEERSAKGVPVFHLPDGGAVTFEPGGQLEYSTPPCRSASQLIECLHATVLPLRAAAFEVDIELLSAGVDPHNPVLGVPLQLRTERYCRMADYFATLGTAGGRMMRQTAAFQVNLDVEEESSLRWRVLNAAAPYVAAAFANSPLYERTPTGCVSYRAQTWRELDPCRTGIMDGAGDAPARYLAFALRAPAIMLGPVDGLYLPFGAWVARGEATEHDWCVHLSTLFPEVRPRGYLEVRSADAVAPEWYAAPIALLAGITYNRASTLAAAELLGEPDPDVLVRAGVVGMHDPDIARATTELFELALRGCVALGEDFLKPRDLAVAWEFYDRYTRRGRSPADDVLDAISGATAQIAHATE